MGQAQINVRTRACSGTFIARTKQAALTHNVRGKRLNKKPSFRNGKLFSEGREVTPREIAAYLDRV